MWEGSVKKHKNKLPDKFLRSYSAIPNILIILYRKSTTPLSPLSLRAEGEAISVYLTPLYFSYML